MEIVDHAPLPMVDGFPFPTYSFPEKNLRDIISLKPLDGDIFISCYPKCGATWSQYIIWEILNDGAVPPNLMEMYRHGVRFLEMMGCEGIEQMKMPRAFKIHLPYRLNPVSDRAKYISVIRNPFDTCVSYYHHLHQIDYARMNITVKFQSFLEDFIAGQLPFGNYFEHVNSWYEHRNDPNVLLLFYEELRENPRGSILRMANFIGDEYGKRLETDLGLLDRILEHTSFEYMKNNVQVRLPRIRDPKKEVCPGTSTHLKVDFFRKGVVGDSKAAFTNDQWQSLDRAIDQKVQDPYLVQKLKKNIR